MDIALAKYRIISKSTTEELTGCWVWKGKPTRYPYPRLGFAGKTWLAHRLSYAAFTGTLDDTIVVDHTCSNKRCVNPKHLEQVTQGENVRRAARRITSCHRGHEYTVENTGYYGVKPGKKTQARYCKECNRMKYWIGKGGRNE